MADPFLDGALDDDPSADGTSLSVTRSGGLVTNLTWLDTPSNKNIKGVSITRSGGLVSTIVTRIFGHDGSTVIAQKTETVARTGGVVSSITTTRDI